MSARSARAISIWLLFAMMAARAQAQSANDAFDPGTNGTVYALAVQPDGKILVGGDFSTLGGGGTGVTPRRNLGRLNADGSVDSSFNPGTNGEIHAVVVQTDGRIVVGGLFSSMGGGAGTTSRNFIGRLNQDGTVDQQFNPGAEDAVDAIALQPDGSMLVGGAFAGLGGGVGTTLRQRIGRLKSDGSVDAFDPGANGAVQSFAVQPDGHIVVGGGFTMIGGGGTGMTPRNHIARLTSAGAVDTFDPNVDSTVRAIALQPNGEIAIGGDFFLVGGSPRSHLTKLKADGSRDDTSSVGGADGPVSALAMQADGRMVVGGVFATLAGVARHSLGRFEAGGALDDNFQPDIVNTGAIRGIAIQSDGEILVAGNFSAGGPLGGTCMNLCRFSPEGVIDVVFGNNSVPNGSVNAIVVNRDGTILIGGYFTTIGGVARNSIARLRPDGTNDPTFDPGLGANDGVYGLALQHDGTIIVGGDFTAFNGATRNHLARLHADGSLDAVGPPDFGVNGRVDTIAVQADGKIVVGGGFSNPFLNIARFQPSGTGIQLDQTFNPGAIDSVFALAIQPDGRILVGGQFIGLGGGNGGVERVHIGRLNSDGSLDETFDPGANEAVLAIALQADGRILVGGLFTGLGGTFGTTPRQMLGRLYPDGSVDTWDPGANGPVDTVSIQNDGKVLAGGTFTALGGGGTGNSARNRLGRITNDENPVEAIQVAGTSSVFWMIDGAAPSLSSVTFEVSSGNGPFTSLGAAVPQAGGWFLGSLSLPTNQVFTVRATGTYAAGAYFGGSGSMLQQDLATEIDGPGPPATPPGLAVVRTGGNSAVATWQPVIGADSYTIGMATAPGGPYIFIANFHGTSLMFSGLTRGVIYGFVVSATNTAGTSPDSPETRFVIPLVTNTRDIDGDGLADLMLWRGSTGTWFWLTSSSGFANGGSKQWGNASLGDRPFLGDIDGDGLTDLIVWRPADGTWYWLTSSSGYSYTAQGSRQWGNSSLGDVPMVGDIDGDGRTDLIVWRASTGTWYWLTSSSNYSSNAGGGIQWGNSSLGDQPVLGDYDGDGKADLAVWRASTGTWYWLTSSSNYSYASARWIQWGNSSLGDKVLTGDIDGDGKADLILWRPADGTWYWLTSSTNYSYANARAKQWGNNSLGDTPMIGDFDGDGRADLVIWRQSTGTWYWLTSSSGYSYSAAMAHQLGAPTDTPLVR